MTPLALAKSSTNPCSERATADISIDTRHPTLQGLTFPLDENVIEAVHLFKKHHVDYIQLEIDHDKECILLSHSESHVTPEHIQKCLPDHQGRYHIYRFRHGSKIKQRMVYASCKESVIENVEKRYGINFDKKLEICDPSDLTMEYLMQQLHPEISVTTTTSSFAKPKAPSTRGPRRLVKTTDDPEE